MMHFINRSDSTFLKTPLTQRVCQHITLTNLSPRSAVLYVYISSAFIFVVAFVLYFLVLFTILFVSKGGTAWEGTGSFRFSWQVSHLLRSKRKALRISPQGSLLFGFPIIIITDNRGVFLCLLVSSFRFRNNPAPLFRVTLCCGACGGSGCRSPSLRRYSPKFQSTDSAFQEGFGIPHFRPP